MTFKAHFRGASNSVLSNYLEIKEEKNKQEKLKGDKNKKKIQNKKVDEKKLQDSEKLTNLEDQFPAQMNFLKSDRDKAIKE